VLKLRAVFPLLDDLGWQKSPHPDTLTIDGKHLGTVMDVLEKDRQGWMATVETTPSDETDQGRKRAKATPT